MKYDLRAEGGIGVRLNERRKSFFLRIGTSPEKRKRENSIYDDDDLPFRVLAILTPFSHVALQMFTYTYYLLPAV